MAGRSSRSSTGGIEIPIQGPVAKALAVVVVAVVAASQFVYRGSLRPGETAAITEWLFFEHTRAITSGIDARSVTAEQGQLLAGPSEDQIDITSATVKGWTSERRVRVEVRVAGGPPPDGMPIRYLSLECPAIGACRVNREIRPWQYRFGY